MRKIELPQQEMKIYLDLVAPRQSAPQAPTTPLSWARITKLLPHIGIFLVVALLIAMFFVRGKMKPGEHYLGAVAGLIVVWLIPVTQVPLQEWVITTWLLPGLKAGKSIYLLGLMPAVIAGAIQLALLTVAVLFVVTWRGLQQIRAMAAGALSGAGFGLMLACYLTFVGGESQLFDMGFVERSFQILFHASSGLIIAVLGCRSLAAALKGAIILASINSLFYYLIVFAQQKLVDAGMLTILLAFVVLATAVWAITLQRRSTRN